MEQETLQREKNATNSINEEILQTLHRQAELLGQENEELRQTVEEYKSTTLLEGDQDEHIKLIEELEYYKHTQNLNLEQNSKLESELDTAKSELHKSQVEVYKLNQELSILAQTKAKVSTLEEV